MGNCMGAKDIFERNILEPLTTVYKNNRKSDYKPKNRNSGVKIKIHSGSDISYMNYSQYRQQYNYNGQTPSPHGQNTNDKNNINNINNINNVIPEDSMRQFAQGIVNGDFEIADDSQLLYSRYEPPTPDMLGILIKK